MIKNYLSAWQKPFNFQGKSTRKEYWQFLILNSIILGFFLLIRAFDYADYYSFPSAISIPLYLIGFLLFFGSTWIALPLTVRRIRDVGMSWKWIFFVSIPYIGAIFLLIFLTRSSMVFIDGNEYYLKYPTKKNHIIGYWIGGVAWFVFGYLGPLIIAVSSIK
ncbi:DUF805 domain-containing protein [Prochlorococcus marinus]|uniref:DUF805 domain-containing protein n=1 Tax=Prochlorococcus marinus TaxID=1219 RepID=UPI001ADB1F37|nr:DUF805 domain-containing protein [Prochlorococcus marinus]MBO8204146.1 DUF805 domain-containing protein [Prochlorococcus marinus CUG1415]MBW3043447.1 hypothetical protein [Prochlorococcus marinus str. MU1415]